MNLNQKTAPKKKLEDKTNEELANDINVFKQHKKNLDVLIALCESQLIKNIGIKKEGGTKTVKESLFKISTNSKLTRKVDQDEVDKRKNKLSLMKYFKTKYELNSKVYKAALITLGNKHEEIKEVNKCITTTPGKTSVTVDAIEPKKT